MERAVGSVMRRVIVWETVQIQKPDNPIKPPQKRKRQIRFFSSWHVVLS
jgi:hypothetical protein